MNTNDKRVYEITIAMFGGNCVFCGKPNAQLHHIRHNGNRLTYLGNVIPLCDEHHRMVHGNEKVYQPMLIDIVEERIKVWRLNSQ